MNAYELRRFPDGIYGVYRKGELADGNAPVGTIGPADGSFWATMPMGNEERHIGDFNDVPAAAQAIIWMAANLAH